MVQVSNSKDEWLTSRLPPFTLNSAPMIIIIRVYLLQKAKIPTCCVHGIKFVDGKHMSPVKSRVYHNPDFRY